MKLHLVALSLLHYSSRTTALNDNGPQFTTTTTPLEHLAAAVVDPDGEQLTDVKRHCKEPLRMFCESMREIEKLREYQLEQLQRSLQVDSLPSDICSLTDPTLKPFLSPKVRAVVEAFPLQAEAIVKKHGLCSDEFNRMLDQMKRSASFRRKVEKEMKTSRHSKEEQQVL